MNNLEKIQINRRRILKSTCIVVGSFSIGNLFVGCGGGGSSSQSSSNQTDIPVQGITYSSNSFKGTTDINGGFKYSPGETITFSVGNVVLGSVNNLPADNSITVYEMAGVKRSSWWNINAVVVSQFIQSLHKDPTVKSFIVPKYTTDNQGNPTFSFSGIPISIPPITSANLMNIPITPLNDANGNAISQLALKNLVATATNGSNSLVNCLSAVTNQIFYPSSLSSS